MRTHTHTNAHAHSWNNTHPCSGKLSTILYRDEVRDIVQKHRAGENPLFLYYATQNVHGPLDDIKDMSLFSDNQVETRTCEGGNVSCEGKCRSNSKANLHARTNLLS